VRVLHLTNAKHIQTLVRYLMDDVSLYPFSLSLSSLTSLFLNHISCSRSHTECWRKREHQHFSSSSFWLSKPHTPHSKPRISRSRAQYTLTHLRVQIQIHTFFSSHILFFSHVLYTLHIYEVRWRHLLAVHPFPCRLLHPVPAKRWYKVCSL